MHDQAEEILKGESADDVIADRGYIKKKLFETIQKMKAELVIPPRSNQLKQWHYNKNLYKERNLIERLFSKIKQFRRVPTPFEKILQHYKGFVALASSIILLRPLMSVQPS